MKITKRKLLSKSKLTALTCAVLLGLYGTSVTGAAEAAPVIVSGGGEAELAKGWSIGGDAGFVRGSHDRDWSCSATVKRMW